MWAQLLRSTPLLISGLDINTYGSTQLTGQLSSLVSEDGSDWFHTNKILKLEEMLDIRAGQAALSHSTLEWNAPSES